VLYNDSVAFVKIKKIGGDMLFDRLKGIFHSNDHKEIMLAGLYLSSMVIFLLLGIVSGVMGLETIFWIKLGVVVLTFILFYGFLKSEKVQLYAIFLIFIVEIDSAFMMLSLHSSNFVTIYPFFVIFGFFFFFKLRAAVWMT